jgi:phosphatidylglycerol---prolipoprotein diacylglyceryl transferase
MRPELFRIHIPYVDWSIPIHSYGFLIVVGFCLGNWLASKEVRRRGLPDHVWDLGMWMLAGGVLGGRIWHYIQFYSDPREGGYDHQSFLAFFAIWKGGLVLYGGVIGGVLGALLYLKHRKLPVGEYLHAIAPFPFIGMAFGRLGCFMNGCCFGKVCSPDFPLGLYFPNINNLNAPQMHSPAFEDQLASHRVLASDPVSLPVYPTQLFEAGMDLMLCALLWWFLKGPVPRTIGFPLALVMYGIERFSLELLRGDNALTPTGLTTSQNLSLVLIAVFLPICIYLWNRGLRESSWGIEKNKKLI